MHSISDMALFIIEDDKDFLVDDSDSSEQKKPLFFTSKEDAEDHITNNNLANVFTTKVYCERLPDSKKLVNLTAVSDAVRNMTQKDFDKKMYNLVYILRADLNKCAFEGLKAFSYMYPFVYMNYSKKMKFITSSIVLSNFINECDNMRVAISIEPEKHTNNIKFLFTWR